MNETVSKTDIIAKEVWIEIAGRKFKLKPYTLDTEIKIEHKFESVEKWFEKLNALNAEAVILSLFWMLELPAGEFDTPDKLAKFVPAGVIEKIQCVTAIAACYLACMPEAADKIQDTAKKVRAQLLEKMSAVVAQMPTQI